MSEQYITGNELLMLIILATLAPWVIATIVQYFIYKKRNISLSKNVVSSLLIFLLSSFLGFVFWVSFPSLVIPWQIFILKLELPMVGFLAFIPVLPMVLATLISTLVVVYLYVRNSKNA